VKVARLEGVRKVYKVGEQEIVALGGVDLEIGEGEMVAIVGPSGSGKSTLMHLLGCLDVPTSGLLEVCGEDMSRASADRLARMRNREIGFIFQSFHLLPRLDVLGNIELPLLYSGMGRRQRRERAVELARKLGLEERMGNRPSQLSGGQCQRVAIARALANDPRIVFADEPTGNLDSATGRVVLDIFREVNRSGRTVVLVTHDADVASVAGRVVEIRDGRIYGERRR